MSSEKEEVDSFMENLFTVIKSSEVDSIADDIESVTPNEPNIQEVDRREEKILCEDCGVEIGIEEMEEVVYEDQEWSLDKCLSREEYDNYGGELNSDYKEPCYQCCMIIGSFCEKCYEEKKIGVCGDSRT